jgi:hypothetical protein
MKKVFSIAIVCCLIAMTGIFSSCSRLENGEWIYSIQLDPSNQTQADLNSYEAFINPVMTTVMKAEADRHQASSNTFVFIGEKSEVLKRAEKAFDKATAQVESTVNLDYIHNIKINLCCSNRDTNKDEVVKSHTFKK